MRPLEDGLGLIRWGTPDVPLYCRTPKFYRLFWVLSRVKGAVRVFPASFVVGSYWPRKAVSMYVFRLISALGAGYLGMGWKPAIRAGETPATQERFAWLNTYMSIAAGICNGFSC